MGTDTIVRLFAPRYYASERDMAGVLHRFLSPNEDDSRIICARRVSTGVSKLDGERVEVARIPEYVRGIAPTGNVTFVDIGEREATYSSSEVRQRAELGQDWRMMVPPGIAMYITENALYVRSQ